MKTAFGPFFFSEPAPLAGAPPSASRCAPMLSGDAPTIGAANKICARDYMNALLAVNVKYFHTSKKCKPTSHGNRHEWVCGLTTLERSDWRRPAHPEMAVKRGSSHHAKNQATQKSTRVGVRADDIGARRLEKTRTPRDGGL